MRTPSVSVARLKCGLIQGLIRFRGYRRARVSLKAMCCRLEWILRPLGGWVWGRFPPQKKMQTFLKDDRNAQNTRTHYMCMSVYLCLLSFVSLALSPVYLSL